MLMQDSQRQAAGLSSDDPYDIIKLIDPVLQAASGLAWVAAAFHVVEMLHAWAPNWLVARFGWAMHWGAALSPWQALCLVVEYICEAQMFALTAKIAARCVRSEVFVHDNIRLLRLIGYWGLVGRMPDFLLGFVEGITDGATGRPYHAMNGDIGNVPVTSDMPFAGDVALLVLPFVMAWVFRRGMALRQELDEVV